MTEPLLRVRDLSVTYGKVAALTMNVLNTALRQLAEWSSEGIEISVSVNLSPYNLRDRDLPGTVASAIAT